MGQDDPRYRSVAPAVLGGAAGLAVALALRKKASATPSPTPGSSTVSLDQATMELLQAMGIAISDIETLLPQIVGLLQTMSSGGEGVTVKAFPSNSAGIRAKTIVLATANTPLQLPSFPVPEGFQVVVKAYPTNAGLIYVAESRSDAQSAPLGIWPLVPNEGIGYGVKDLSCIYVAASTAGDMVSWTVEQ